MTVETEWSWVPPVGETVVVRAIVHTVTVDVSNVLRKYDNVTRRLVATREMVGPVTHRRATHAAQLWLIDQGDGSRPD